MSQYQLISSGAIIAKVFSDFRPTTNGWVVDAVEWLGEALEMMRVAPAYTLGSCEAYVQEHRCRIPCNLEYFGGIEHNGYKLECINPTKLVSKFNINLPCSKHTYQLNPNYIHTDFEEGTITIHYYGFCFDEHGAPMIPDDIYVKEAISWYILYKYLLRGGTHPTLRWQDAEPRWLKYKGQAENSVKRMTPDKYVNFANNWVALVPKIDSHKDFYSNFQYNYYRSPNSDIENFTGTTLT
jgi:hypothetical protein